ncbi:MAG: hypothetical protein V1911_01435 [Candidatus Micrarchaeota archaeon]
MDEKECEKQIDVIEEFAERIKTQKVTSKELEIILRKIKGLKASAPTLYLADLEELKNSFEERKRWIESGGKSGGNVPKSAQPKGYDGVKLVGVLNKLSEVERGAVLTPAEIAAAKKEMAEAEQALRKLSIDPKQAIGLFSTIETTKAKIRGLEEKAAEAKAIKFDSFTENLLERMSPADAEKFKRDLSAGKSPQQIFDELLEKSKADRINIEVRKTKEAREMAKKRRKR